MRVSLGLSVLVIPWLAATPASAIEGPAAAGPIGGTDMRSALMPPPGLYAGSVHGYGQTIDFLDGDGRPVPPLKDAVIGKTAVAPFVYASTGASMFDGSIGIGLTLPVGINCGRLSAMAGRRCSAGTGDLYGEIDWARFFGTLRPSNEPGALPIAEGLAVMVGFGTLFPTGAFDRSDALHQGLSPGNNLWDFAPSFAATYTTPAFFGEGTEFSAKFYRNSYLTNTATRYRTGPLLDLDFSISEHLGRFQAGFAGIYAVQSADDTIHRLPAAPDGRRYETLTIGPVLTYDLPEFSASMKIKALRSIFAMNAPTSYVVLTGWVQKF